MSRKDRYFNLIYKYYKSGSLLWGLYTGYPFLIEGFKFNTNLITHFQTIINLCKIDKNLNILEAGCGYGEVLRNLSLLKPYNRFVGITLSKDHIAKKRFNNVFVQNFDNTEFECNSFDRILFIESFSHSFNKLQTLKEVHRLLKPGGMCFILDLAVSNSYYFKCGTSAFHKKKYKDHIGFFGDKPVCFNYMIKLFNKLNFELIEGRENLPNSCIITNTPCKIPLLKKIAEKVVLIDKLETFYNYYLILKK